MARPADIPGRKLNIGCGVYPIKGHVNIDINPRCSPDVVRDVRKGLPYDTDSVAVVRAWHFLEHLYREELLEFIAEAYRVLQSGGQFRFLVPLHADDELDHVQRFAEDTFDTLCRPESADYFQCEFDWRLLYRNRSSAKRHETLEMWLEAVK